jgi:hypothetical protein
MGWTDAGSGPGSALDMRLWEAVGRIVDRAPSLADLEAHQLAPFAVARWPAAERRVPDGQRVQARATAATALSVPLLLERIRDAVRGPILLIKGPEVSSYYPARWLRPHHDLDLLVPDPVEAQRSLVRAGFVAVGDEDLFRNIHHLRPLHLRGFPLVVEIHSRPKWVPNLPQPPLDELFASTVPSSTGVDGLDTLARPEHAIVLAAHAWAHDPLGRLRQLVDVAAVCQGIDRERVAVLAAAWGAGRLWDATSSTIDALFGHAPTRLLHRIWAGHLSSARERTVLEEHLQRWLSPFSLLPRRAAVRAAAAAVARDARPEVGEGWQSKLRRTRSATRNAFARRSAHEAMFEGSISPDGSPSQPQRRLMRP